MGKDNYGVYNPVQEEEAGHLPMETNCAFTSLSDAYVDIQALSRILNLIMAIRLCKFGEKLYFISF